MQKSICLTASRMQLNTAMPDAHAKGRGSKSQTAQLTLWARRDGTFWSEAQRSLTEHAIWNFRFQSFEHGIVVAVDRPAHPRSHFSTS
jgi:hypothetical protein